MGFESSFRKRNFDARTMKHSPIFCCMFLLTLFSGCKTTSINPAINQTKKESVKISIAPYSNVLSGGYELMLIRPNESNPFFWMDWDKAYRWKMDDKLISLKRGVYKDSAGMMMFNTVHQGKPIVITVLNKSCGHKAHGEGTSKKAIFSVDGKIEELCALNLYNPVLQNKWFWVKNGQQAIKAEPAPYLFLDLPSGKIMANTGEEMLTADCSVMGSRMKIGQWKKQPKQKQLSGSNSPNLSQLQQSMVEWFMKDNNLTLILPDESHWVFSGAY